MARWDLATSCGRKCRCSSCHLTLICLSIYSSDTRDGRRFNSIFRQHSPTRRAGASAARSPQRASRAHFSTAAPSSLELLRAARGGAFNGGRSTVQCGLPSADTPSPLETVGADAVLVAYVTHAGEPDSRRHDHWTSRAAIYRGCCFLIDPESRKWLAIGCGEAPLLVAGALSSAQFSAQSPVPGAVASGGAAAASSASAVVTMITSMQEVAPLAQMNVDVPKAFTKFANRFAWTRLQINGSWLVHRRSRGGGDDDHHNEQQQCDRKWPSTANDGVYNNRRLRGYGPRGHRHKCLPRRHIRLSLQPRDNAVAPLPRQSRALTCHTVWRDLLPPTHLVWLPKGLQMHLHCTLPRQMRETGTLPWRARLPRVAKNRILPPRRLPARSMPIVRHSFILRLLQPNNVNRGPAPCWMDHLPSHAHRHHGLDGHLPVQAPAIVWPRHSLPQGAGRDHIQTVDVLVSAQHLPLLDVPLLKA